LSTADELDALLDRSAAECGDNDLPHEVEVFNQGEKGEFFGIQLGIGHPERSFVHFLSDSITVFGYQLGVGYGRHPIAFDRVTGSSPIYYPPSVTRVTPAVARQAAREYVTTGHRPFCLRWLPLTWGWWFTNELSEWHDVIEY
jgi:hypothetical protein